MSPYICLLLLWLLPQSSSKEPIYLNSKYHIQFDAKLLFNDSEHTIIQNKNITLKILNSSLIINNKIAANWNIDSDWNEITLIHNALYRNNHRRLFDYDYKSWNVWDHTTEHHKKSGRFIGESKYKRTFDDARSMCTEFYAELASIRNSAENEEVKALCHSLGDDGGCWLGLRTKAKEEWSDIKRWIDHHPLGYTHWATGKPDTSNEDKQCVEMHQNGFWNNVQCEEKRYAICEDVTAHKVGEYIAVYKRASWTKANLYCKMKYGSELATITSKWKQMEAQDALKSGKSQFDEQDAWIGFHQKAKFIVGGLWTWTGNNDIVSYKNWGLNEPQHSGDDNKRCAVMDAHSTSGVWMSEDCGKQKWILCNAKEETPTMSMRDLIFPPTLKELRDKQNLLKTEEETEQNEKKIENELAKMRSNRQKHKETHTEEDDEEMEADNHNDVDSHLLHFGHHRNVNLQTRENMDELNDINHKNEVSKSMSNEQQMRDATFMKMESMMNDKLNYLKEKYDKMEDINHKKNHFDNIHSTSNIFKSLMNAMSGISDGRFTGLNLNDYDRSKDPYFGKMNEALEQQKNDNKGAQGTMHQVAQPKGNNLMQPKQTYFMQPSLHYPLQQRGFLFNPYFPPSGNANDPYGFNTRYNPQFYPHTQLGSPFAMARRRLMQEFGYSEVKKCVVYANGYKVCMKYDVNQQMIDVDLITINGVEEKEWMNVYFEQINVLFEMNPYKTTHKLCYDPHDVLPTVCLEKSEMRMIVILNDGEEKRVIDFLQNDGWDEVYSDSGKKCIHLQNDDAMLCVMPIVDFNDYLIEIKRPLL